MPLAFYCSLTIEKPLANRKLTFPEAGKGEISWDVFGGEQAPLLAQLLVDRCKLEMIKRRCLRLLNLKTAY